MTARVRARWQLILAVVAAAGCVWSWVAARSEAVVAPVAAEVLAVAEAFAAAGPHYAAEAAEAR